MTKLMSCLAIATLILLLGQCQGRNDQENDGETTTKTDQSPSKQKSEHEDLKAQGKTIVKTSAKALKGRLQSAIREGGIENAIKFCSVEAMPLTDSLAEAHEVSLARVSHKNRNPANAADSFEQNLINRYQMAIRNEKELKPKLVNKEDQTVYYHPIRIKNGLCLNCHGKRGKTLTESNYQLLRKRYPKGSAIGFEIGDLRGLWKVQFKQRDA